MAQLTFYNHLTVSVFCATPRPANPHYLTVYLKTLVNRYWICSASGRWRMREASATTAYLEPISSGFPAKVAIFFNKYNQLSSGVSPPRAGCVPGRRQLRFRSRPPPATLPGHLKHPLERPPAYSFLTAASRVSIRWLSAFLSRATAASKLMRSSPFTEEEVQGQRAQFSGSEARISAALASM